MSDRLTARELLDREFLQIRCRLLDLASALDRIERAEGAEAVQGDPRLATIQEALGLLLERNPDRAVRVQHVFSIPHACSK